MINLPPCDVLSFATSNESGSVAGKVSEFGTDRFTLSLKIPAGSIDLLIPAVFLATNAQSVYILASQDLTLLTNRTSSPGDTFDLLAGVPLVWSKSAGYFSNPFTADVTALYASCDINTNLLISVVLNGATGWDDGGWDLGGFGTGGYA